MECFRELGDELATWVLYLQAQQGITVVHIHSVSAVTLGGLERGVGVPGLGPPDNNEPIQIFGRSFGDLALGCEKLIGVP